MEFNPGNHIIRFFVQGIIFEEKGNYEEAGKIFSQAWNEASNDFEKFLAAYFAGRNQKNPADKLKWLETSLQYGLKVNDEAVKSAYPALYSNIAKCYEDLNDSANAKRNSDLAHSFSKEPADPGPFYHGTKADLKAGDLLKAGSQSNYKSDLVMNHIYFTALINGAGLAAALAKGEGRDRVYIVEPTGPFENDPNVTDKKFPGNLTRSYRSQAPLKIIGEVPDWTKQTTEDNQKWREKLADNKGEIIN